MNVFAAIACLTIVSFAAPGCSVAAGDAEAEAARTDKRPAERPTARVDPDAKASAGECEAAWQNIVSISVRKVETDMRTNGADEAMVADTVETVRESLAERGQEFVTGCTDAMPALTVHCFAELQSIEEMSNCSAAPQE